MKKLLLYVLIIASVAANAQTKTTVAPMGNFNTITHYKDAFAGGDSATLFHVYPDTPSIKMQNYQLNGVKYGAIIFDSLSFDWKGWNPVTQQWAVIGVGGSDTSTIRGGAFTTSNVQVGFNPGTNITTKQLIEAVFYGNQPPTATLTSANSTLELTSAPSVTQTLNWGAGRGVNTPILTSIVVAGVSQSFSQPSQPGTVTGTQNVAVPANTTTTYSNVVTAQDGQTATANFTFNWLGKKYYGLLTDTTGITTGSLNSNIIALTSVFATTKALTTNTGAITGTEFWCYAYPSTLGDLSALSFNSIPALDAMNKITLSITNASGYTQNYTVYYNKQGQTIPSDITAQ